MYRLNYPDSKPKATRVKYELGSTICYFVLFQTLWGQNGIKFDLQKRKKSTLYSNMSNVCWVTGKP